MITNKIRLTRRASAGMNRAREAELRRVSATTIEERIEAALSLSATTAAIHPAPGC